MPSLFQQFGLDFDPAEEVRKRRQEGLQRSLGIVKGISGNSGVQGAANIGAMLGNGFSKVELTPQQKQIEQIQAAIKDKGKQWADANPDASEEDKAFALQDITATEAVRAGRTDIGSELFQQTAERKRARDIQNKNIEMLGYQTTGARANAAEATRGDMRTVWMRGETDPNKSFTVAINPNDGSAVDSSTGKVLRPGEYTEHAPLDPQRNKFAAGFGAGASGAMEPLDPDTVHNAVVDILQDPNRMKQYASYGATGQAHRDQINRAMSAEMKAAGITRPEILRQQAIAKGQIKSTSDLIGMKNAVSAYETLARGNGQRFLDLATKVNKAGIPLINSAMRIGKMATGDPDAAELLQVLQNYKVETARIVNNPRLVGQLTVSAVEELNKVIPANLTVAQAARIVNRFNFEFDLRNKGIDDALEMAAQGVAPGQPRAVPAPAPTPQTKAPTVSNW